MPGETTSRVKKFLIRTFQLLLRLYPRQFRRKFGREMQAVFADTVFSTQSTIEGVDVWARELRDFPGALTKSWLGTLRFRENVKIGDEDPVVKEISTAFRKQKLKRIVRIGATLTVLIFLYYGCNYTYTTTKIAQAKNQGVYPTAEEGMRQLIDREYIGIQRTTIFYAGPDSSYGNPHVWYVVAEVYAMKRASGSEMGRNGCDNPGVFFVETDKGWVSVSEGAIYFGNLAHWMRVFGLTGPGQAEPSIDRLGNHPRRFCRTP